MPNRPVHRFYLAAGFLVLLGWAALLVDVRVATFFQSDRLPGDIHKTVQLAEVFAHGTGVALICLTVWVLDRRRRRWLPRLLAFAFGAGLAANLIKCLVARWRPLHADLEAPAADSFAGLLPAFFHAGWDHALQSFPSGHAATAAGLALGLSRMYPQGAVLFGLFAVLAALQRLVVGAHFLSDVLIAAAVACLVGAVICDARGLGRIFDRWEGDKERG